MRLVFLLLFPLLLSAECGSWCRSVVVYSAASAFDASSSYGRNEVNPVLGAGRFGGRQLWLKFGITAGVIATQALIRRKTRRFDRAFQYINYGASAAYVAAGTFALSQPRLEERLWR